MITQAVVTIFHRYNCWWEQWLPIYTIYKAAVQKETFPLLSIECLYIVTNINQTPCNRHNIPSNYWHLSYRNLTRVVSLGSLLISISITRSVSWLSLMIPRTYSYYFLRSIWSIRPISSVGCTPISAYSARQKLNTASSSTRFVLFASEVLLTPLYSLETVSLVLRISIYILRVLIWETPIFSSHILILNPFTAMPRRLLVWSSTPVLLLLTRHVFYGGMM